MVKQKRRSLVMKLYTVVWAQVTQPDVRPPVLKEFKVALVEAETEALARYSVRALWHRGRVVCTAELGDTRANHPGCQEFIFQPAQVDITEVIP
jgi:hypothetical protein